MAILTRVVRFGVAGVLAMGTSRGLTAIEQRTSTAEDAIKATFLFNFTKFVDWPPPADAAAPFRICIAAEPAFAEAVDRTIVGETVRGRPLERVLVSTPNDARACQILFIGRGEAQRVERWIAPVRDLPVLLVGESRGFWEKGGHINFVLDDNHVRFDVNQDTASRTGLVISSKLLRVARNVTARGSP
jgi:YfiR/HmsC-like